MLWCNEDHTSKFENIEHHTHLCKKFKNLSLDYLQNTMFCGMNGCGKKNNCFKINKLSY